MINHLLGKVSQVISGTKISEVNFIRATDLFVYNISLRPGAVYACIESLLMTLWNLTTSTLHKEPPLIRDTPTAHKGSSLMAGGGAIYLYFDTSQCKISSDPFMSSEKDDGVQCCIPYGR